MKSFNEIIDELKNNFKELHFDITDEYIDEDGNETLFEFKHNAVTFRVIIEYVDPYSYNISARPISLEFEGYTIDDDKLFYEECNDLEYIECDENESEDTLKDIAQTINNCTLYKEIEKATNICNKINIDDSDCNYSSTIPSLVKDFIDNVY